MVKNTSSLDRTLKYISASRKKTQKNQSTVIGFIDRHHRRGHFLLRPFVKNFDSFIFLKKSDLQNNDCHLHAIVRVSVRHVKGKDYEGKVVEVFKNLDSPELELEIIQQEYGFPSEFPQDLENEILDSTKQNPGKRRDLKRVCTVTIDGETAKDFDDAISVEKLKEGNFRLRVSIADVSFFVREGTKLDQEAFNRGTSIYFPGFCIPMLPEELSNNLCSLVPGKPRFTLTCEVECSPQGEILSHAIYPSEIQSHARLTYTTVSQVIEHGKRHLVSEEIADMLETALELSKLIRSRRFDRGSLEMDLPEVEFDVEKNGDVKEIRLSERNEAHRLIEDFMILANECVSEAIEKAGYASVFRVHDDPDPLKMERLRKVARAFGFAISDKKSLPSALQNYLDSIRGNDQEKMLLVSMLRSLKQAHYSADNIGHFGLGSKSYCHFTSPIRRYPDLLIHRILRKSNFLKNKVGPINHDVLQQSAETCSEREQRANLSERSMEDMKKARFLEKYVGKTFDGWITSVKEFGLFVELKPYPIDGLLPFWSLSNDNWSVDELETRAVGRRSKVEFQLGDAIRVQVVEVNRLKRQITLRYLKHLNERPDAKSKNR